MANLVRTTDTQSATRSVVYAGLIAAAYYVLTIALAPISFGPLQFRVAGLLVPLCLLNRRYILGLAVGLMLANLFSPFGWWDFLVMPLVAFGYMHLAYTVRHTPWFALGILATLSALAVTIFPLHLGGGIPVWPTLVMVFVPQAIVCYAGWYVIWRRYQ